MKQDDIGIARRVILPGDTIDTVLFSPKLEQIWNDCLSSWEDATQPQRDSCQSEIAGLRNEFVQAFHAVDDPQEQRSLIAVFYTQIKAQWIVRNTQVGYQAQSGQMNQELLCRAGMLSALLGEFEPLLEAGNLARITDFLAATMEAGPTKGAKSNPANEEETEAEVREVVYSFFEENVRLRVERDQIIQECGATTASEAIAAWRSLKNNLAEKRAKIDAAHAFMSSLFLEFGKNTIPADIVARQREMSSLISRLQSQLEALQVAQDYIARELGVSDPEQIVQSIHGLRDRIKTLNARIMASDSEQGLLKSELNKTSIVSAVAEVRSLRDNLAQMKLELDLLRMDRELFARDLGTTNAHEIITEIQRQNKLIATLEADLALWCADQEQFVRTLGKVNAREIVALVQALQARVDSFRDVSDLLGNMEQALKTLDS